MPRPNVPLEAHKQEIIDLYKAGNSAETISLTLQNHGINVTARTIQTRLREWNAITPASTLPQRQHLERLVSSLFRFLNTKEILHVLQEQDIPCSTRTLCRIRQRLGIKLRTNDPEERERQKEESKALL
ncbi:hypothetical protein N7495_004497 [Penicillium taxi]|uniref:uncharacterized protein n=1 Tax=Penicillium taxi TaxID=168475 RepID=UPI00254571AF|nr:uncharacterized protein N7495_004497 [Penicillium taxi]KAJ5899753.1 hypothetical protein N7495_004497 [Penicillium taxi]